MILVEEYNKSIKELLNLSEKRFVFSSIMEGHTQGQIYVNDLEKPEVYVIMDGGNFVLYFGGNTDDADKYEACVKYAKSDILTSELRNTYDDHILIAFTSEGYKEALVENLNNSIVHKGMKSLYRYDLKNFKQNEYDLNDYVVKSIDDTILNSKLENLDQLLDEIKCMWGNEKPFLEYGFGYCAVRDSKLLAWCAAEFVSSESCGIGIETIEDEQGKGIGTHVALKFVERCYRDKITPHWDSWLKNYPSVKIAQKVEFDKIEDYEAFVVKF